MLFKTISIIFLCIFDGISAETKYGAIFTDKVRDCEDYENNFIDMSGLQLVQETAADSYICGTVTLAEDIEEASNYQITATVYLDDNGILNYIGSTSAMLCDKLDDIETPWYPLMNGMKVKECPIMEGTYEIKEAKIDMSRFDPYMKNEFCGVYLVTLCIEKLLNTPDGSPPSTEIKTDGSPSDMKSCHQMSISVIEFTD